MAKKKKKRTLKLPKKIRKDPEIQMLGHGFIVTDEFGEEFRVSKKQLEKTKAQMKKDAERLFAEDSQMRRPFDDISDLFKKNGERSFRAGQESEKVKYKSKDYEFIQDGDYWRFSFEGKSSKLIRHQKGFTLIAYLLKHPKRKISAEILMKLENKMPVSIDLNKSERKEINSTVGGLNEGFQRVAGSKEISLVKAALSKLQAKEYRTPKELEEIDSYKKYLREAFNPQNKRLKGFESTKEKVRKAASIAINRAIKNLKANLPELSDFLIRELDLGSQMSYRETKTINWHFSLMLREK